MTSSSYVREIDEENVNDMGCDYDRNKIKKFLNWKFQFIDKGMHDEYFEYCRYKKLTSGVALIAVMFSMVILPFNLIAFAFNQTVGEWIFSVLSIFGLIVVSAFSWRIFYDQIFKTQRAESKSIQYHQFMVVIGLNFYLFWNCARALLVPTCENYPEFYQPFLFGWHCTFALTPIPHYSLSFVSFSPLLLMLVFHEYNVMCIVGTTIIRNIGLIIIGLILKDGFYSGFCFVWTLVTVYFCFQLHYFRINNFLAERKLKEKLLEIKQMQENRTVELRHMIGNLAHDLKTVSVIFKIIENAFLK